MLIIFHVFIALLSLATTSLTFISPGRNRLNLCYFLTLGTIATGTYLTILLPAHMVQACISGLIYLAFISVGLASSRKKLQSI